MIAAMSRMKENRSPRMSDVRGGSSIEYDADIVLLLEKGEEEEYFTNTKLIVDKNRHGQCGRIPLKLYGGVSKLQQAYDN